ncbi:MAG: trimethylamine methyltransferase family protein [Thiotrichales bacterium]|nr:trimethylamine methyltransferase family protein [Thiotrichales bacterium]
MSFEQWTVDGALDANERALRRAKEMLRSYQPPAMDEAVDEALREYIAKREAELPEEVE